MVTKVTKKLNLRNYDGFTDLSKDQKERVKEEVGNFVKESILNFVGEAKSPVTGRQFKGLTKDYKKRKGKLSSAKIANLELTGDMLDSLEFEQYRDGIEIGIFDEQQAQKADNHCKFSAASKKTPLPPRKFIPTKDEKFTSRIETEVQKIIREAYGEN